MITFIISICIALFVSFLCSLAEATLLSVDAVKLETDRNLGKKYAILLSELRQNINRPISAILILNTIAHTGGATIAGSAFDELYGDDQIWIFSSIFTVMILFGTEILPKVLGISYSAILAKYITYPLIWTIRILKPLIKVSDLIKNLFTKNKGNHNGYSLQDIQTIARLAHKDNVISDHQEIMILQTSNLNVRTVKDIMLPIEKVIFFREDIDKDEYHDLVEHHLHTRYPLSKTKDPQDIFGYLNFKEIALKYDDITEQSLQNYARPILFVNHNKSIGGILKEFNSKRIHLAMVVDERETIIGMITLEDLIEEIVGEIEDEFDQQ